MGDPVGSPHEITSEYFNHILPSLLETAGGSDLKPSDLSLLAGCAVVGATPRLFNPVYRTIAFLAMRPTVHMIQL